MFIKRNLITVLFILSIIVIVGCSSQSPEETIVQHLEETIVLEKTFEEEQEKINELELKDQQLYEEIIQLDMDDFDKIVELSEEAIEYLDKRLEHLQLEKESIEASKEEFLKIEKYIEQLDSEEKKHGEAMFEKMVNRFNAYDEVYDKYTSSIDLTKQLYESLQTEEIDEKEVISLITKVNDSYELVFEANDTFNNRTEEYNHLKEEFYALINRDESSK